MASAWQIVASNGSIAHLQQVYHASLQCTRFFSLIPELPAVQFLTAYSIMYSITYNTIHNQKLVSEKAI